MVRSLQKLLGNHFSAIDGEIGIVKDLDFDDRSWRILYIVVELGSWLHGKIVLVSPSAVAPFDGTALKVELTKAELQECPHFNSEMFLSQQFQHRTETGLDIVGIAGNMFSGAMLTMPTSDIEGSLRFNENPHVISCKEISQYKLVALDGVMGTIQDLIVDDALWRIRFIVAHADETSDGQAKLFWPQYVDDIDCKQKEVTIGMTRSLATTLSPFDPSNHLDVSYKLQDKQPWADEIS